MFRKLRLPIAATSALLITGCAHAARSPSSGTGETLGASAVLVDFLGKSVGTATFTQAGSGPVRLQVDVVGLNPGSHGIHIHAVGSCASSGGTPFAAAGAHFNPGSRAHGLLNPNGTHGGDLPNLTVGSDGRGHLSTTTDRLTLAAGPTSVFDADGSSIVIHAAPDDQRTDPSGSSGARFACGVLQRS